MKTSTIHNSRPPNDPADFVTNRIEFSGVTKIRFDAETDQMQVGARPLGHGAVIEWVHTYQAVGVVMLTPSEDPIPGPPSQTSATSS